MFRETGDNRPLRIGGFRWMHELQRANDRQNQKFMRIIHFTE